MQNNTQIRQNQKGINNNNDEVEVKNNPQNKKQPVIQQEQSKYRPPDCPSCKRKHWLKFDRGW